MATLRECLTNCRDFDELKALAHPRVRQECGKANEFEVFVHTHTHPRTSTHSCTQGGVKTWTKVTAGSSLHMLLGEFRVDNVTVETFKASLAFEERVTWDDLFIGGTELAAYQRTDEPALDIFHRSMRFRSPAPLLISARDFEVLIAEKFDSDGAFVCKCNSVLPSLTATIKGSVRGTILTTGFIAKPVTGQTKGVNVFYVAQIDPKGWIPNSVVNLIISRQARSIQNLKKHITVKSRQIAEGLQKEKPARRPIVIDERGERVTPGAKL